MRDLVSMAAGWGIYGVSMGYLSQDIEFDWGIYGVSILVMVYLWFTYGVSMGHLWVICEISTKHL